MFCNVLLSRKTISYVTASQFIARTLSLTISFQIAFHVSYSPAVVRELSCEESLLCGSYSVRYLPWNAFKESRLWISFHEWGLLDCAQSVTGLCHVVIIVFFLRVLWIIFLELDAWIVFCKSFSVNYVRWSVVRLLLLAYQEEKHVLADILKCIFATNLSFVHTI